MNKTPRSDNSAAEYVPVADLRPWVKNPRKNDPAVKAVADSIRRFGFGAPLLARRENGEIIAGHTRLKAAVKLGLAEVPVRYLDLSEAEAHALALADNKVGEIAEWDDDTLANVLRELEEQGAALDGLGFSDAELKKLLATADHPDDDESEEPLPVPEEDEAVSVLGEVYELGPHRLVCGDSRDAEAWAKLLPDGEKLRMVWTDPPYGVAVNAVESVEEAERLHRRRDGKVVLNDVLTPEELAALLRGALGLASAHGVPGAAWYVASPPGPLFGVFGSVLHEMGVWRHTLIWSKDVFAFGRSDMHYRHEPIFYGWTPGAGHYWCGRRDIDSVFEVPRPKRSKDHPTMKPVKLVRQHIEHSSEPGWIVGEPFGGSGTTLIASACTGRVARLIELSPAYCDVIRRRWTRWARANGQDPGAGALDG